LLCKRGARRERAKVFRRANWREVRQYKGAYGAAIGTIAVTAVMGLIAYPILQPTWVMVR
jgi:hypothetical protein